MYRNVSLRLPFSGLALFAAATVPGGVLAQTSVPVAPTRDQIEPELPPQTEPTPRLVVEGGVERSPCALADPAYANVRIRLSGAEFNASGPVNAADLRPAFAALVGQDHPISIVCEIRDAAATILRDKGYLAAVQVPVQKIENGLVRFEILYAKVTSIRVIGDGGSSARTLEKYLSHLASDQPFNRFDAERYLLLSQDLPGYMLRLSLRPTGRFVGDMVGEVRVNHTPIFADFTVQNLASRSTGRFGGQLRAQFNGLTGHGDRTSLSAYSTADFREQQVYQIGHDMMIGANGLRIGGKITYAITRPNLGASSPPVRGRTIFGSIEASYPIKRSQAFSLTTAAGLEFVKQNIRFAGLPLSTDRLRVAYVRFDGDAIDLKGIGPKGMIGWRLRGGIEARRGLSILSASPNCIAKPLRCTGTGFVPLSLSDGDPTATVVRGFAEVELRPLKRFTVLVGARGQIGASALAAFEQFSAGNYTIGRGFDPGTLTGDSGAGFQTEIRMDPLRLSRTFPLDARPYVFGDHAWVWNKGTGGGSQRLSSFGGGMRLNWQGHGRLDLSVAAPARRILGEDQRRDTRFLMTLTTTLLPWRTR
jgi:hemolysin activation/secretion protein